MQHVRGKVRRLVSVGAGAFAVLLLTTITLGATASANLPTEPLGQIDVAAGGPGYGINPLAVSEQNNGVAIHGTDIYMADQEGVVRKLDTSTGKISVFTGNGEGNVSGLGGPATDAGIGVPQDIATDTAGDVFIMAGANLFEVPAASVSQFGQSMVGTDIYQIADVPISPFNFSGSNLAVDAADNIFFGNGNEVQMVAASTCASSCLYGLSSYNAGDVNVIAGGGSQDYGGDGGPALDAGIAGVDRVAVDSTGNVYFSDSTDERVREVSTAGTITTLAGGQGSGLATGIGQQVGAVDFADGSLYVADGIHADIHKIDPTTGVETTIGGDGVVGYTGDSDPNTSDGLPATQSELELGSTDAGMAVDPNGDVFFVQEIPQGPVIRVLPGADSSVAGFNFTAGFLYTIAGGIEGTNGIGYTGDDGPAPNASFGDEIGQIAVSSAGLFIADTSNDAVRMIALNDCSSNCPFGLKTTTGDIYTVAGTNQNDNAGDPGYSGDNGPATSAQLNQPQGVAVDGTGNLFIADTGNNVIREVSSADGTITTYAGSSSGTAGNGGNGGPALSAEFDGPQALSVDASGILYVDDVENDQVREIAHSGSHTVSATAGTGTSGFSGDGGTASAAELNLQGLDLFNSSVNVDPSGDLYIGDVGNDRVREVFASGGASYTQSMSSGDIYTIAGNGTAGTSGDGGPASSAELLQPTGVGTDPNGDVYVYSEGRLREVAATSHSQWGQSMTAGDIYTMAGNGIEATSGDGGPALAAGLEGEEGLSFDSAGDAYFIGNGGSSDLEGRFSPSTGLREISATSPFEINTVTGNGLSSDSGDGGPADSGQVDTPSGTATDRAGDVFFVDSGNNRVRMVASNTCSANCPFGQPTTAGDVYTVAGNGTNGTDGDGGSGTAAAVGVGGTDALGILTNVTPGLAVDPDGDVLIPDGLGAQVRLLAASDCTSNCPYGLPSIVAGDIYDVAGDGTSGDNGNGGPATAAELGDPKSVAVDPEGNIFISDDGNADIRMVAAASCTSDCPLPLGLPSTVKGDIYTVAGDGTAGYSGDNGPGRAAEINITDGVGTDPNGDLLIADPLDEVVRLVANENCALACAYGLSSTTAGDIYTVGGDGSEGAAALLGDPATTIAMDWPDAVTTAPDGTMFVAECLNNQVAAIDTSGKITRVAGPGSGDGLGDGGAANTSDLSCGRNNGGIGFPNSTFGDFGMSYDAPRGNFYLSDPGDQRVRVIGVLTGVGDTVFTPADNVGGDSTSWDVTFTTSTQGALDAGTGTISLTAPPGTTLPTGASAYTINGTAVTAAPDRTSPTRVILTIPVDIAASTAVSVEIAGVGNPPSGTYRPTDSTAVTSADPEPGWLAHGLVFTTQGLLAPPAVLESFTASSLPIGGTTRLNFTVTNPSTNGLALSGVGFTDTLPAGLMVTNPDGTSGSCDGGTIIAMSDATSLSLAGASLPVDGSCAFSVNVTASAAGVQTNSVTVTSTNGGTGNTSTASVDILVPPVIGASFGAGSIALASSTSLDFTITNPAANTVPLTGVSFDDILPAGLLVATPNGLNGSCGVGTIGALAGSSTVSLTGATLGTGDLSTCTFSVNVTGTAVGNQDNSVSVASTNGGAGNTASANLSVTLSPPTLLISFGATSIPVGATTTLTFKVIDPAANTTALNGVAFSASLPSGLVVATPNGETGGCGAGTIGAVAGSSTVTLSGALVATNGSCTLAVNVLGASAGPKATSAAASSSNGGTGATTSASLAVVAPPVLAISFSASPIATGSSTSLDFTITNPAANTVPLTGVSFDDILPAGLLVATPNGLNGSCGVGTIGALAGSSTVSLTGATLGTGDLSTCTFSGNVTGTAVGNQDNSVSVASTNGGAGNTASATVDVVTPSAPGAPDDLFGTAGNGAAGFTWVAPASDGGEAITSYAVSCEPSGSVMVSGTPPLTTGTITGLTNGTTYTCTVDATNTTGTSGPSNRVTVTPEVNISPLSCGYRLSARDGGVFDFGCLDFFGSLGSTRINAPIVGLASTPTGTGYWLVGTDGGVYAFGDAPFLGSLAASPLPSPIAAIAATSTGKGYWLVADSGTVYPFGDAGHFGSVGPKPPNAPIVAMTVTPDGGGYWLTGADGGVFAFGDAQFFGSLGSKKLDAPVVGMAVSPDGEGYWLVAADGGVFSFGDAKFFGSMGGIKLNAPIVGIAETPDAGGYWLVAADGGVFSFGDAKFFGSMGGIKLNGPITGIT